jgi:hypothetical protein
MGIEKQTSSFGILKIKIMKKYREKKKKFRTNIRKEKKSSI